MDNLGPKCPIAKIITLGCKVNQYESDWIFGDLKKKGVRLSSGNETPDLVIINTCAVTHKAAVQSKQVIRKSIREYPDAVICTTGCLAQSELHQLYQIPGIDYIIGNADKHLLPEILSVDALVKKTSPYVRTPDLLNHRLFGKTGVCSFVNRARPYVKIQDGCNDFCSYCIVPFTRGPSRSRPIGDILDEIAFFAAAGAHEIVLTGVHIGRYGVDLTPPSDLFNLLTIIIEKKFPLRIRLSSIEPNEITDDILSLVANSSSICPHFHIPLQSGDERILKKMNRPYSPQDYHALITKIHHFLPHSAIGVDVMVGFPGENADAFTNTLTLLDSLPISYLHVFPYSRRPNTAASRLPDQNPSHIIKSRFHILQQLGQKKKKHFYDQIVGRRLEVIIEHQRDKSTGLLKGMSENYIKVLVDGNDAFIHQRVQCHITGWVHSGAVMGKPIEMI